MASSSFVLQLRSFPKDLQDFKYLFWSSHCLFAPSQGQKCSVLLLSGVSPHFPLNFSFTVYDKPQTYASLTWPLFYKTKLAEKTYSFTSMSCEKGQILAACAIACHEANPGSLHTGIIISFIMWKDNMPQSTEKTTDIPFTMVYPTSLHLPPKS